jgi:hypothetical protein
MSQPAALITGYHLSVRHESGSTCTTREKMIPTTKNVSVAAATHKFVAQNFQFRAFDGGADSGVVLIVTVPTRLGGGRDRAILQQGCAPTPHNRNHSAPSDREGSSVSDNACKAKLGSCPSFLVSHWLPRCSRSASEGVRVFTQSASKADAIRPSRPKGTMCHEGDIAHGGSDARYARLDGRCRGGSRGTTAAKRMSTHAPLSNLFIYLVGFGGAGKLTIARALAPVIGAKIVDNHWINNPIFGLIDPDGVTPLPPAVWVQVGKVHDAVMETIATLAKPKTNFVFTHEGVEGNADDRAKLEAIRLVAARRGARFIPVRLLCEEAELVRRIQSPERAAMLKGINPAHAINRSRHHTVLDPKSPDTLSLDVTRLPPEESVAAIIAHIKRSTA